MLIKDSQYTYKISRSWRLSAANNDYLSNREFVCTLGCHIFQKKDGNPLWIFLKFCHAFANFLDSHPIDVYRNYSIKNHSNLNWHKLKQRPPSTNLIHVFCIQGYDLCVGKDNHRLWQTNNTHLWPTWYSLKVMVLMEPTQEII